MSVFIVLAAALVAATIALVAWPFFKARAAEGRSAVAMAAVLAIAIPLAATLLYREWSTWSWSPAAQMAQDEVHSMQDAVATLEARLAAQPEDVDGWMLLGRTYLVTNDFQNAARAYQKAHELTGGRNAEATANYAEALALIDPEALGGRAGELFEAALEVDPANPKGLWYGGLKALGAGDNQLARDRWAALAATNPPPDVRAILDQRVAELDQMLGNPNAAPTMQPAASKSPAAEAPAQKAAAPAAAAQPGVPGHAQVRVTVAPQLASTIPPGTPLFILARDPSQPGPPLAAKRLVNPTFPLDVTLTEQDAMSPGRTIASAKQLEIVARFSKTGVPMATAGDPFGEASVDMGTWSPVGLVIDRRVP